jgi:hypothetical protein
VTTWPSPPQREQVLAVTIWPSRLCRAGALAGAGAATVVTAHRQLDVHGHLVAEHGLLEGDVGDDLEVLAPRRAGGAPAAVATTERAATTTEERLEDVAETAAEDVLGARSGTAAADARLAEAVVAGALVGVGEHLVGAGDLLELLGRMRVAGVGVGMQLARPLAVGALDLLGRGVPGHPEELVEISHDPVQDAVRSRRSPPARYPSSMR